MNEQQRARLVAHGAIVFLLGMSAGFPFAFVILGRPVPGDLRGWHMAHLEGILNGIMLWAIAAVGPYVRLAPAQERLLVLTLLVTAWGNIVASLIGPIFGARGLEFGGNIANSIMYLLFMVAVVTVIVACVLVFRGARARMLAPD